MRILVTNDDGVNAPGLLALARAMMKLGDVCIMAPDRNWSGSGHVKTLDRPLRVQDVLLPGGIKAQGSDGAPSDCVALAILGYYDCKIDLVVSGINPMPNLGHDVTYSGTVTAAMEAVIWGIPGVAFSPSSRLDHLGDLDYRPAAGIARRIVETFIKNGFPSDRFINVNIPDLPEGQIRGVRVTRQGLRVYRDRLDRRVDPRGKSYFWIGGDAPTGVPQPGTDIGALDEGYVSVTPLMLDLTDHAEVSSLGSLTWELGKRSESPRALTVS
jgi:5'/3'-nucleotidase